ncbi:MAG TPA: protoporphyrinogen oxidase [Terriglobales bacterium]|nr:protoporphyrinogen oxidase [Terriglobales bacterium]
MKRVAIIGGGISGLAAAFYLERERRKGAPVEYTLFESAPRLGGVMWSERAEGCLIEAGPDSFLTEKPWANTLCRDLGMEDQIVGSNDDARKTFILVNGRLVSMPDGLMFMVPTKLLPTVFTSLFSWATKMRMAGELLSRPRPPDGDESAADFVARHYGDEVVDRLADPLLSGVYGGDADSLSVRAVLPRFVEMEARYGSLSRGMLKARSRMKAALAQAPRSERRGKALFSSMREGMQQLVDAVAAGLDRRAIRLSTPLRGLALRGQEWLALKEGGGSEPYDHVILATPAYIAGALLHEANPRLAATLDQIPYSSSVTVALGYDAAQFAREPEGFGFLVPWSEKKRMRACTYVHNKFPHRAPPDKRLLRVFLGGTRDKEVLSLSDAEILSTVTRELRQIIALDAQPRFTRIYRWNRAMAQYAVGHLDRVAAIERLRRELPGLSLAGNAYKGIGVPDCVHTGMDAAADVLGAPVVEGAPPRH